jgi:membrane-associated phospholipid phosphatase
VAPEAPATQSQAVPAQDIPQIQLPQSSNFVTQFMKDETGLWSSPFRVKRGDAKWLLPIGVGAAALFVVDHKVADAAIRSESLRSPSKMMSHFGSTQAMGGASVGLWAMGHFTHNDRLSETGSLATQGVFHTQLISSGLKFLSHRERPNGADNKSLPSGHAMTSFAFASVVAHEYHDKPLIVFGSYGLATAISLSRVGGLNHFPSDVLVGAVIGELIGRYMVHHHSTQD